MKKTTEHIIRRTVYLKSGMKHTSTLTVTVRKNRKITGIHSWFPLVLETESGSIDFEISRDLLDSWDLVTGNKIKDQDPGMYAEALVWSASRFPEIAGELVAEKSSKLYIRRTGSGTEEYEIFTVGIRKPKARLSKLSWFGLVDLPVEYESEVTVSQYSKDHGLRYYSPKILGKIKEISETDKKLIQDGLEED